MTFKEKLNRSTPEGKGICVGLDPVLERLPQEVRDHPQPLREFCSAIVQSTWDLVSAYKVNLAYFERYGSHGWAQLESLIASIPPGPLVIADGKRNDVPHSAQIYASAAFEELRVDALTVNPYLGRDSIQPFISYPEHGAFLLALTSNQGANDLQTLDTDGIPLYLHIIRIAQELNHNQNIGLVIGATISEQWEAVSYASRPLPLLIPGVGAQGGDLQGVLNSLSSYPAPVLINVSRTVIYASSGSDFAEAARQEVVKLKKILTGSGAKWEN
ncbi:MAG: orotidine-5'-phosphate decarboxylase [bacterium]